MTRARLTSTIAVAAVACSALVLHGVSGLTSRDRPAVTLLYVGADDCAPCRVWQDGEGAAFRASPEFSRLTYREVKSPTLLDVLKEESWPEDLRGYRDRIERGAGVPLWLVITGNDVVGRGFGPSQWRQSILPQLRSLLR